MMKRLFLKRPALALGLAAFAAAGVQAQPAAAPAAPAPAANATASKAPAPETVLATVNGKSITQGEVDAWVNEQMMGQLRNLGPQLGQIQPEQIEGLRQMIASQARTRVIEKTIFEAELDKYRTKATDADVQARIDEITSLLKEQGESLEELLKAQGIEQEKFRSDVREQIAAMKMVEAIEGSVEPTQKEIAKYLEDNKAELARPEQIKTSHILIGYPDEATTVTAEQKQEARAKAAEVLAKVKAGGDFAELAKEFSSCPSAPQGGDLGYSDREAGLVEEFKDAAWELKEGEVTSAPVETQFGYHIIKVTDKKPATEATLETVGTQIKMRLRDTAMRSKLKLALDKLTEKAEVKHLVPEPKAPVAPGMPPGHPNPHGAAPQGKAPARQ